MGNDFVLWLRLAMAILQVFKDIFGDEEAVKKTIDLVAAANSKEKKFEV